MDGGHLASAAALVPVPRDSGRRTGNLHRPQRHSRRLRRAHCRAGTAARRSEARDANGSRQS
ncbi:transposase [Streptomyces sp. NPDC020996]|uniref:transposase n=1 Tax=Streptomyces sp. NPDC020996 TaxID=3154791 RepID=UPI00340A8EEE